MTKLVPHKTCLSPIQLFITDRSKAVLLLRLSLLLGVLCLTETDTIKKQHREPHQKYRLSMVSIKENTGGLNPFNGVTLAFSCYIGWAHEFAVYSKNTWSDSLPPTNIKDFKHTPKILEILAKTVKNNKTINVMYLVHHFGMY